MFILKYREDDVWGYISNISQIAVKEIDTESILNNYKSEPNNMCEYADGDKLPKEIANSNIIFTESTSDIQENNNLTGVTHMESLIKYGGEYPVYAILLYLQDHKEYENIVLVTDQETYLMNNEGKTIERIA